MSQQLHYLQGFGNYLQSEATPGILLPGRNSPQKVPQGLYAEQLSGSAFTAPRHMNLHSWLYRIRPSVMHDEFIPCPHLNIQGRSVAETPTPPTQMRWDPLPFPNYPCDFLQGIFTLVQNGSPQLSGGAAIHLYAANQSMHNYFFYNADGELLIVPQEGNLRLRTEFGLLDLSPTEIAVIPRGIKFQVILRDEKIRGYICENFGQPFRLPELGIIGANGLANPRDFQVPVAAFEETTGEFKLYTKFQGNLWMTEIRHSPLDVVAWHGNYVPYKYNLHLFNTINSVSFDHPDPSIFTVLTSPSPIAYIANVDFVIFPPRWLVAEQTFRLPYYHRNVMNEYMGLITGQYDAKENGFIPGGGSLNNCMAAHGPDKKAYERATNTKLEPEYYANTLAFMFESQHVWQVTKAALQAPFRQKNYLACWKNLPTHTQTEIA